MSQYSWATCPEAVRTQVHQFREHAQAIIGMPFIGLYLHGSLAMGCFNPTRSDIDLLVVTAESMNVSTKRKIAEMLLRTSMTPNAIEISFLVESAMHPFSHPLPYDFHYSETWREDLSATLQNGEWQTWNEEQKTDADLTMHITVINNRGICLYGKPIREVFPAIPAEYYTIALFSEFQWALQQLLINPTYFILNACRIYAYTREGSILSKDEGGTWGLRVLPEDHHALIQQALNTYRSGTNKEPKYPPRALDTFATYIQECIYTQS